MLRRGGGSGLVIASLKKKMLVYVQCCMHGKHDIDTDVFCLKSGLAIYRCG